MTNDHIVVGFVLKAQPPAPDQRDSGENLALHNLLQQNFPCLAGRAEYKATFILFPEVVLQRSHVHPAEQAQKQQVRFVRRVLA